MKSLSTIAVAVLLIAMPACFAQQVVGSTKLGVAQCRTTRRHDGLEHQNARVLGKKRLQ